MKKGLFLVILLLVITIWLGFNTYQHAFEYKKIQSNKASIVAMEKEPGLEISSVSFYYGINSYSIIYGSINNNPRIVCVPTSMKDEIIVIDPTTGITAEEALQKLQQEQNPLEIKSVNFGVEQNTPIWEIVYIDQKERYSYYYLTFKDGKFIKRYTL